MLTIIEQIEQNRIIEYGDFFNKILEKLLLEFKIY